ncbi:MAG: transcription termination factor NusA [Bacteroidales bacterium]|jgi:N utilization substance protein A|nr:transcription termination factor NusA [Bacteroidales bacterium]
MSENLNLISTFSEFKEFKNIERESLMRILEETFKQMLLKKHGMQANINVIVNIDRGEVEFQRCREIVEDGKITNPQTQIQLSDAIKIEPDFEIGEEVTEEISYREFDRRDILNLRQILQGKITDYQKDVIYQKYNEKIGEIIKGTVVQIYRRDINFVDEEGIEVLLPHDETLPNDFYRKGDPIRAVVVRVEPRASSSLIVASRTSPLFLERLMEEDIPEIYDGLMSIKNIVRIPGIRAKVAVETFDDRIDPVGACIGMRGTRIQGILKELHDENIDIIPYSTNIRKYIKKALNPAKVSSLEIDEENKHATAYVEAKQISFAVGKDGWNIKLAGKLTGYDIDVQCVKSDAVEGEDVELKEFSDEIDPWIIEVLKGIGCDTGRSVLELSREELIKRTDLEDETVDEIIRVIQKEFEE